MFFGSMFFPGWHGRMWPGAWPLGPGWGFDSFLPGGLFSLGIFLGFFGVLHIVLAWGLFERQPWARVLGLMLGVLALLRFPFGTALAIYTLWVLAPEESAREYGQLVNSGGQINGAGFSASGTRCIPGANRLDNQLQQGENAAIEKKRVRVPANSMPITSRTHRQRLQKST